MNILDTLTDTAYNALVAAADKLADQERYALRTRDLVAYNAAWAAFDRVCEEYGVDPREFLDAL